MLQDTKQLETTVKVAVTKKDLKKGREMVVRESDGNIYLARIHSYDRKTKKLTFSAGELSEIKTVEVKFNKDGTITFETFVRPTHRRVTIENLIVQMVTGFMDVLLDFSHPEKKLSDESIKEILKLKLIGVASQDFERFVIKKIVVGDTVIFSKMYHKDLNNTNGAILLNFLHSTSHLFVNNNEYIIEALVKKINSIDRCDLVAFDYVCVEIISQINWQNTLATVNGRQSVLWFSLGLVNNNHQSHGNTHGIFHS